MSVYRQKYEDWFNALNEAERKAETARMNSSKTVKRQPANNAAKNAANNASTTTTINEPKFVNVPSNVTPAGPAFSITNLTPVVMQSGQQVQMQMQPQQAMPIQKDRQQLLDDILKREPVEPARSAKQLFVNEYLGTPCLFKKAKKVDKCCYSRMSNFSGKHKKKNRNDGKAAWKALDKKEKKKWHEKLEPQRQRYIDDYTIFVRRLDKEELEMYTELKQKRDEEEESQNDSSDSDSDSSESDDSDSESDSDSDIWIHDLSAFFSTAFL